MEKSESRHSYFALNEFICRRVFIVKHSIIYKKYTVMQQTFPQLFDIVHDQKNEEMLENISRTVELKRSFMMRKL